MKTMIGATALTLFVVVGLPATIAAGDPALPDVTAAAHYLATTTNANGVVDGPSLAHDGYYEAFDQFGDFGLTIDGALALAASGTDSATLRTVVDFLADQKTDGSAHSVNDWTGIGTPFASGGSIGKEALLAEVVGLDPRNFAGHDLIAGLDGVVCTTTDVINGCGGPGNYRYATSTFSQALGVIAQLRAADSVKAAGPIAYLESLQNAAGAWPSLIPASGNSDVDSTAIAAMALAAIPNDPTAANAAAKAVAWIAGRQDADGGFDSIAVGSANSTALAIQALALDRSTYATEIAHAQAFLVGLQNSDGGFSVAVGDAQGSDVRATAQVVSGIGGVSFATLTGTLGAEPDASTTTVTSTTVASAATPATAPPVTTTVGPSGSPATVAELPATGAADDRLLRGALVLFAFGVAAIATSRRRGAA